jgi:transposase InsO family protein
VGKQVGQPGGVRHVGLAPTHAFPVAPNLLGRDFHTAAPNRVWLADLAYIWPAEGWLHQDNRLTV